MVWLVPSCGNNPIVPSDVGIGLERLFPYLWLVIGHLPPESLLGVGILGKCVPWSVPVSPGGEVR